MDQKDCRRSFLKCAGAMFSLAALGIPDLEGAALPVAYGASASDTGSERRYPIPTADGVMIDRKNQVITVRYQQHLYAFNLACPHENTALRWKQANGKFECPKHNSRYTPEGKFIDGRATRNMDRLGVKRDGNNVVVDLSDMIKSDQKPSEWAAAAVTL